MRPRPPAGLCQNQATDRHVAAGPRSPALNGDALGLPLLQCQSPPLLPRPLSFSDKVPSGWPLKGGSRRLDNKAGVFLRN